MGDRDDRARAWRRLTAGIILAILTLLATTAIAVAIPTEGENPHAWGVVICGAVTMALCGGVARRNRSRLRHYSGADLPVEVPARRPRREADPPRSPLPTIRRS
jgi:hypothetical protein